MTRADVTANSAKSLLSLQKKLDRKYGELIDLCDQYIGNNEIINARVENVRALREKTAAERIEARNRLNYFIEKGEVSADKFAGQGKGFYDFIKSANEEDITGLGYVASNTTTVDCAAVSQLATLFGVSDLYEKNTFAILKNEEGNNVRTVYKKQDADYKRLSDVLSDSGITIRTYDADKQKKNGGYTIEYSPEAILQLRSINLVDKILGIASRRNDDFLVKTKTENKRIIIESVRASNIKNYKFNENNDDFKMHIDGTEYDAKTISTILNMDEKIFASFLLDVLDKKQIESAVTRLAALKKEIRLNSGVRALSGVALKVASEDAASGQGSSFNKKRHIAYINPKLCTAPMPEQRASASAREYINNQRQDVLNRRKVTAEKYNVRPAVVEFSEKQLDEIEKLDEKWLKETKEIAKYEKLKQERQKKEKRSREKLKNTQEENKEEKKAKNNLQKRVNMDVRLIDRTDDKLFEHEPDMYDVNQGYVGDCYFMSTLAALVKTDPAMIEDMIKDNGNGTVTVRFYRASKQQGAPADPVFITVKKTLIEKTNKKNGKSLGYYQGALWVSLIEKAFSIFRFQQFDERFAQVPTTLTKEVNVGQGRTEEFEVVYDKSVQSASQGKTAEAYFYLTGKNTQYKHFNIRNVKGLYDDALLLACFKEFAANIMDEIIELENEKELLRVEDVADIINDFTKWKGVDQKWLQSVSNNRDAMNELNKLLKRAVAGLYSYAENDANCLWQFRGMDHKKDENDANADNIAGNQLLRNIHHSKKAKDLFEQITERLKKGPVTYATRKSSAALKGGGQNGESMDSGIVFGHAYTVLGTSNEDGHLMVIVRNPWGQGVPVYRKVTDEHGKTHFVTTFARQTKNFEDESGNGGLFFIDINDFMYYGGGIGYHEQDNNINQAGA